MLIWEDTGQELGMDDTAVANILLVLQLDQINKNKLMLL